MPGNIDPVYSRQGSVATDDGTTMASTMTTATGDYTGVSANHVQVWKANATNGGFLQKIRLKAIGTNVATVARIYINNGSTHGTASNNTFYGECSLQATVGINTQATMDVDYPMNIALDPGFTVWVGLATTVASGWVASGVGGRY